MKIPLKKKKLFNSLIPLTKSNKKPEFGKKELKMLNNSLNHKKIPNNNKKKK